MKSPRFAFVILTLLALTLALGSCSTGYTGESGGHLEKYLEPEAMKSLLEGDHPQVIVIDVRPSNAYAKGHLPGAVSVPSSDFPEWYEANQPDEDIIVYCETGGRAQGVVKYLEGEDFNNVMNWGGYTRWEWDYETGE